MNNNGDVVVLNITMQCRNLRTAQRSFVLLLSVSIRLVRNETWTVLLLKTMSIPQTEATIRYVLAGRVAGRTSRVAQCRQSVTGCNQSHAQTTLCY